MTYEAKNWTNNESVTATDLNAIEDGIRNAHILIEEQARYIAAIEEDVTTLLDHLASREGTDAN